MKKSLALVLALVFVLGIAGTAFAANPFVDVPAKHWAYGAVSQLVKAGIVDGYDDNTFRGDKSMTRYEMAQVVAKAMAKSDKADAANKALIEKLSAEFSAELNNLGVRVGKLEANASNLKVTADLRVRYNDLSGSTQQWKDRFRMNMTSQINENTSLYARFVYDDDTFNSDDHQRLSDMALTTKGLIGGTDVTVGRYTLNMGPTTYVSGTTGDLDGIMTNTKSGDFGLMLGYAQARTTINSLIKNDLTIKNIGFAEATYNMGKAKLYADLFKNYGAGSNSISDAYDVLGGGVAYTFDKNLKVSGEYYTNSAKDAQWNGKDPKAQIFRVAYKGAAASQPGTYGLTVDWVKFEGNALPYGFAGPMYTINPKDWGLNAKTDGYKAFNAEFDYTLAKNITFNAMYQFDVKSLNGGTPYTHYTRAQINYMF